jgi:general secretion pathway protein L
LSRGLIIWIDADDAAPLLGQVIDEGTPGAVSPLADWAGESLPDWVTAFAPVSAVRLISAALPPLPQLQRDAVAREQLSAAFAGPVHLVSGMQSDGALTPVAWVDPARLSAWQALIREAGLEADAIIPAALLIGEGDVADLCGEEVWGLAEGVIPADLGHADEMPSRALNASSLVQTSVNFAGNPPLNLLTGRFAPRRASSFGVQKKMIFTLLSALAVVSALIPAAQAWRTNRDAAKLEGDAQSMAAASFAGSGNPVAALDEAVSARQGGGAGFVPTLQAVSAVVEAMPGVELSLLSFSPDGWMSVTVRAASTDELERVARKLEGAGFRVVKGAVVAEQGRQSGQFRVRG